MKEFPNAQKDCNHSFTLAITSVLSAQESTDKTITIGTDILPLIGGFANGHFVRITTEKTRLLLPPFLVKTRMKTFLSLAFSRHIACIQVVKVREFFLREDLVSVSSIGIMPRKKCLQLHFGQLLI